MGAKLTSLNSRSARKRTVIDEINITPFVDVMLVLLIIFMVTSPMLVAGINVDLPETASSPLSGQDEPLTITVDSKGNVYILETMVKRENLIAKLNAITKENFNTRIFVRGDKNVSYGSVIEVVGEINSSGFTKVALITNIKHNAK